MNESINACLNPYQHICGKYANQDPWYKRNSEKNIIFYREEDEVNEKFRYLLENALLDTNNTFQKFAAYLYKSCNNQNRRQELEYRQILEFIDEIGGFPMIDKAWNDENFDAQKAFVTLRTKHNLNSFIALDFEKHHNIGFRMKLKLPQTYFKERMFLSNSTENTHAKKQAKLALMSLMKIIVEKNRKEFDESVFEKQIDELIDFELEMEKLSQNLNNSGHSKVNVSELDALFPNIEWKSIFTQIFAEANYKYPSHQQIHMSHSKYYYDNLSFLLHNTPKRIIANYLASLLILRYAKFTTEEISEAYENIEKLSSHYKEHEQLARHVKCVLLVREQLFHLAERLFVDKNFSPEDELQVNRMFADLKHAFESYIDNISWMDRVTKDAAFKKILKMKLHIGSLPWIRNDKRLQKYYSGIDNMTDDNFVKNMAIINAANFLRDIRRFRGVQFFDQPVKDVSILHENYDYRNNLLTLKSCSLLRYPLYNMGAPIAAKYGSLGTMMAVFMNKAIVNEGTVKFICITSTFKRFLQGMYYDDEGNTKLWYTKESVEMARSTKEKENMFIGMSIAFKAYKLNELKFAKKDMRLPKDMANYSSDQLFFISLVHMFCGNGFDDYSFEKRANIDMKKFTYFNDAFDCCSIN
ncbi:hypothetical protein B4U79_17317 [Dinothrombium tinctorium]|uniref:Peptidase M13 N-terminal domain-containing protein n=1 Tax=Dinothrombium tinctorium TaxID=1965070 RepID=A0A3S3PJ44_9ACAR|nr:hypothetical protein B4U79_17595 [Dinothrombium tinctorium]RWS14069.1 hypothetical protein B4U79_17317 [Dinothrombium tinctorium]